MFVFKSTDQDLLPEITSAEYERSSWDPTGRPRHPATCWLSNLWVLSSLYNIITIIILYFIYIAPLKTEYTKCCNNRKKAENSGRRYGRINTQQSSQTLLLTCQCSWVRPRLCLFSAFIKSSASHLLKDHCKVLLGTSCNEEAILANNSG